MTEKASWLAAPARWVRPAVVKISSVRLRQDYQEVFSSPAGERVLADMHRKAGLMYESLDLPSEKLHEVAGAQSIVYYIDRMLRLEPVQRQALANIQGIDD